MRLRIRDPRLLVLLSAALLGAAVAFPLGVIASHRFSDVPTSSTFHDDIDAIADVGVTTGCGVNLYCPKDFVTREQMAAFLNRLGALAPGKTPVVNADKVDGRDASDLTFVSGNTQPSGFVALANTWGVYEQVLIDAPSDGYVLVSGSVSIGNVDCTALCPAYGAIEFSTTPLAETEIQQTVDATSEWSAITLTRVLAVESGPNTIQVRLRADSSANGDMGQSYGQITAIFSPFGETHQ